MFKLLFATLLCLAHGQVLKAPGVPATPSASPSATPSASVTPLPFPLLQRRTPTPSPKVMYSAAPTGAVGKYLGTCGRETPAFRKRCKKCCWQTKNTWKHAIRSLRRCDRCRLKKNLDPGNSGPCPYGAPLGWSKNPNYCFYERCHKMLVSKGPCMCF